MTPNSRCLRHSRRLLCPCQQVSVVPYGSGTGNAKPGSERAEPPAPTPLPPPPPPPPGVQDKRPEPRGLPAGSRWGRGPGRRKTRTTAPASAGCSNSRKTAPRKQPPAPPAPPPPPVSRERGLSNRDAASAKSALAAGTEGKCFLGKKQRTEFLLVPICRNIPAEPGSPAPGREFPRALGVFVSSSEEAGNNKWDLSRFWRFPRS
ncbi:PREDICTED: wiskott-Aldrich syndrome protein family member 2-like [Tinamus guttatus]|uniref:wiskott-Aldrich syndrome protein family member 2-like n=1 Tax=Tinamus guttatus TaxID=94827 RepID=UPI00052F1FBB|nr:PREDICTED: wiskott-Aldrich syndrome protein family member 2-like [Tinamus guttatus]